MNKEDYPKAFCFLLRERPRCRNFDRGYMKRGDAPLIVWLVMSGLLFTVVGIGFYLSGR